MKNLKKSIAVVLTFALVFSAMAVGFAASPFTDVKSDAPYASAVERLYALNITSGNTDGTYGVDQPVTRAMMTVFVNRISGLRGLAEMAKNEAPAFKDVPKDYWAIGDINLAAKLGLTHGVGDGKFDPEGKVTYVQALGFMLNVLGYKNLSWPYGVVAQAQDLGLTAGINNLGYNDVINRGDLALVMNTALDQQIVASYDTNGNPVLGNKLISKIATVANYLVVATPDVDSTVPAGQVSVMAADNSGKYTVPMTINAGSVDFNKYLGKVVTVYSAKFGNPMSVDVLTTDVKTFTTTVTPQATSDGYYFTDAAVYAKTDATLVIDGIKTTLSSAYGTIDKGTNVTLINNANTGYNYVIANAATGNVNPYIVKYNVVSGAKYIDNAYALTDSYGNAYKVEGAVKSATDIRAGDVIYYVPVAGTYVIYVVRNTVSGTVSQISVSGSTTTATINGTAYIVAPSMVSTVKAGAVGTATLDKNNEIIAWAATSTPTAVTSDYAAVVDSQNFSNMWNTQVALAKTDGTTQTYNVVYANVYPNNPIGTVKFAPIGSIVNFTVNSNGQIDSMSPVDLSPATYSINTTNLSNNAITVNGDTYYVSSGTVALNATVDSNNKVTALTPFKISDLQTASYNGLKLKADNYGNLSLIILANATFTTTQTVKPVVYVTGYSTVTTSTSTTYTVLNVLENGVSRTYNATSDLGAVAKGVYELTLDTNGNVIVPTLVTDTSNTTEKLLASSVNVTIDYTNNGITFGTTYKLLDPNVVVIDATGTTPVVTGLANISTNAKVNLYTNSIGKVNLIVIVQ